jgi:hypothetical protein
VLLVTSGLLPVGAMAYIYAGTRLILAMSEDIAAAAEPGLAHCKAFMVEVRATSCCRIYFSKL